MNGVGHGLNNGWYGAINITRTIDSYCGTSDSTGVFRMKIDASKSNQIYTDNGKVYPASIALNFIIKA